MRDIRTDLKERLTSAEERRSSLNAELAALNSEIATLIQIIDLEDGRFGKRLSGEVKGDPAISNEPTITQTPPIGDSLVDFLLSAAKSTPRTKRELRDAAVANLQFKPGESPGRVVHFTLINLERAGRIKKSNGDRYVAAEVSAGRPSTENPADMFENRRSK